MLLSKVSAVYPRTSISFAFNFFFFFFFCVFVYFHLLRSHSNVSCAESDCLCSIHIHIFFVFLLCQHFVCFRYSAKVCVLSAHGHTVRMITQNDRTVIDNNVNICSIFVFILCTLQQITTARNSSSQPQICGVWDKRLQC